MTKLVAHMLKNKKFLVKEELKSSLAKILIVSDVSATTVVFFSKDKKCKCLTASCTVILNTSKTFFLR